MKAETEQQLAHTLLIELLAYQFASPVRWIETQDVIFQQYKSERLVEIGPSPTLANMANRTLKTKYESFDAALSLQRQVLCYAKDAKEIYYTAEPVSESSSEASNSASTTTSSPTTTSAPAQAAATAAAPAPVAAAAAAPIAAAPSGAPAAEISDVPVPALDILRCLIAQKLKKPIEQISIQKAIKDMVGGKSTLQNEILGDLGKEFGSTPEKPEETPLDELAAQFQATFSGKLGKQSSSLVARLISSKMPGGFNLTTANKYLQDRWGLGSGRRDGVFLLALTLEPPARLSSESEAKSFLDSVVTKYAAEKGISLSSSSSAAASGGASSAAAIAIDSAAFDELTKDQTHLVRQQLELFAKYLKQDLRAGDKALISEKEASSVLQKQLDLWLAEHGDFYASGIAPSFSPLKARRYDSSWNWARQEVLTMYYDIIFGKLSEVDREIVSRCILIMNRSNPLLVEFMQYHIDHVPEDRSDTYALAKRFGQQLIDNCKDALTANPVYKDVKFPTGPHTTIDPKGNIKYEEVVRPSVRKLEQYVKEMAQGGKITQVIDETKASQELQNIYKELANQGKSNTSFNPAEFYKKMLSESFETRFKKQLPFLHLRRKSGDQWVYDADLSSLYLKELENAANVGISYSKKYVLVTGAGAGSIGADLLKGLLAGGAKIVVTTSRYSREVTEFYQSLYVKYGAKGSTLIVVPFNQGSKTDVENLINYIYDAKNGLGWDLDFVIPFAAISENGRELESIDSKSELAHRIMLTNLLRLLGCIKVKKQENGFDTRPAQVILPLSPNHGTFGGDGLYSESKLALETLLNRWHAESWKSYLTICGAVIGWTRGTGLMAPNNIISEAIEKFSVRTFSQQEMAFNILGLLSPAIVDLCQSGPVFADLNGGLQFIPDLKKTLNEARSSIVETSEIRRAVAAETAIEFKVVNGAAAERFHNKIMIQPRANLKFEFPKLKEYSEVASSSVLRDMVDLERVVVVTGFAEIGPWGNSHTRWEMEAYGEFSLEGAIEMAWIMGLIKNFNGTLKSGKKYAGWVDTKTGEPVDDKDVKAKYEKYILQHSGIRLIEPELFNGYNPEKKKLLQEVVIEHDLEPFEGTEDVAKEFLRQHGDKVEIFQIEDSDQYTIRILKGAVLYIPKALRFDRLVAGQVPTGWDPKNYGLEEDIVSQVDRVTLFTLVSVAEALLSSGISDPYEFYKYAHVSEVGNCIGSGVGGMNAFKGMFKDRFLDKPVQMDILQESFANTMAAWVNMLLISSSGPIRTPVGACATALESVELGYETIVSGKAKICLVGGVDDFQEDGSYEFANMKATSNAVEEFAHGRTPGEMSRPATTTRSGFMESHGAGIQVIMSAKTALAMGVPIYGIVGLTATASDKNGRSVPAPGKGILTTARESNQYKFPSPLLDLSYRKRQIELRRRQVKEWTESEYLFLESEANALLSADSSFNKEEYMRDRIEHIEKEASKQIRDAIYAWNHEFWRQDPRIAPIRGALSTWNLTVDDIRVASFHGTSTGANEANESDTVHSMMEHLGRSRGNALLGVFQKYLTGHPKGAAAAWMMNGVIQVLGSGYVPGNRNADNIDSKFEKYYHILYPSKGIQTDGVKAASVTSFGFGQKGAQAIIIHPDILYSTLSESTYNDYKSKVAVRYKSIYRHYQNGLCTNSIFVAKSSPPYKEDQEKSVYLEPLARVTSSAGSYSFPKSVTKKGVKKSTGEILETLALESLGDKSGNVGVDVESLASINISNETFLERNYTEKELEYAKSSPSPHSSLTGIWAAKEAVFKSLSTQSAGAGAPLKDIHIDHDSNKAPIVVLTGAAKSAADAKGIKSVKVSISHDDYQAVAVAYAA